MIPYVTTIIVRQRQRDLQSESVTSRLVRAAVEVTPPSPSTPSAVRLRQAIAGAWSLAGTVERALPGLRDYPYARSI